jgi:hypothetical protein
MLGQREIPAVSHLLNLSGAHLAQLWTQDRKEARIRTIRHQSKGTRTQVITYRYGDPLAPSHMDTGTVVANGGIVDQIIMNQRGHVNDFDGRRQV